MSFPNRSRRVRATFSVATAAGLVLGIIPLGLGSADAATPPPVQSTAEFCQNVADDFDIFEDIAASNFEHDILCLAWSGVTRGASAGSPADPRDAYNPRGTVTRLQMARFITRMMDLTWALDTDEHINELWDHDGEDYFTDVRPGNTESSREAFEAVNRLREAEIALGGVGNTPATRFSPSARVTRGQMATFIARADAHLRGRPIPNAPDYYTDDAGHPHERRINAVTSLGIAQGRTPGRFDPDAYVNREQMAAFLVRTMAKLHADGLIDPIWDFLDMPDEDLSNVEATDNGNGSATITFNLRNYRDEPIEGLTSDLFWLVRYTSQDSPYVDELVADQPTRWSFTEVGGGVYTVVHTSPVNTSFVVDIVLANYSVVAEELTVTITGAGTP